MESLAEALWNSLSAAAVSPEGVAPPVAILWTDPEGQWRPLIEKLRESMPELYCLGDYNPAERTGPAIWLKCVVERAIPDVAPAAGVIPILYLPGVARQILRAGGECPVLWQPLIELQYRGAIWHQRNGRDWTVEAFLASEQGLGLNLALDARTRDALLRALPLLLNEPVSGLRNRRLEADDFDRLSVGDPVRDLLMWMNDPTAAARLWAGSRWVTFCEVCRREFDLSPDRDHVRSAGEHLLTGGDQWDPVWRRFREAPKAYPGVARLLRECAPKDIFADAERQPLANEQAEASLAKDLNALAQKPHNAACARLLELDSEHAPRRSWVWADLGQSPLAVALEPLAKLARAAQRPLGGANLAGIIKAYVDEGWLTDAAALESLASASSSHEVQLIGRVVRSLYEPWLDQAARGFQAAYSAEKNPGNLVGEVTAEKDVCLVFVDGLRFDVAQLLLARLEARGMKARLQARLTTLPTVTATAKPAATPARPALTGGANAEDFTPVFQNNGQAAVSPKVHLWLGKNGTEVIPGTELRGPAGSDASAWTETGRFDHLGHSLGVDLPRHLNAELDALVERLQALLAAGWTQLRIITDHGWLLLPGGLPKVEMPHYLVASKWSRCATLKGESATVVPEYGWFWNPAVRIAIPHGIGAFTVNSFYSHGGLSPQELITPDIRIERSAVKAQAKIAGITWRGLRCRVQVSDGAGLKVDLRSNWKQAASSYAAAAKEVDAKGEASLAVLDDSKEGSAATVVLLDAAGQVIDHQSTTIGDHN